MSGKRALNCLRYQIFPYEEAPAWYKKHARMERDLILATRFLLWHKQSTLIERLRYAFTGKLELFDDEPVDYYRNDWF